MPISIHDWRRGRSWYEERLRQIREEERAHVRGVIACSLLGILLGWVCIMMAVGP